MTTLDASWALVFLTALGLLGGLVGVLWKFSKSVDKNTIITQQILDQQKAQWGRIDENGADINGHETRIVKLETWKDYHQETHGEAVK